MLSLCRADEQNAVHIGVAHVDCLGVDGLTILEPGCNRAWLTLLETKWDPSLSLILYKNRNLLIIYKAIISFPTLSQSLFSPCSRLHLQLISISPSSLVTRWVILQQLLRTRSDFGCFWCVRPHKYSLYITSTAPGIRWHMSLTPPSGCCSRHQTHQTRRTSAQQQYTIEGESFMF